MIGPELPVDVLDTGLRRLRLGRTGSNSSSPPLSSRQEGPVGPFIGLEPNVTERRSTKLRLKGLCTIVLVVAVRLKHLCIL